MLQTGVPACDAIREMALTGNVIPQIWYRIFVKRDLKKPKPHLLAINILADIVYWYRPREIRDEGTGQVIGYQKKFRDDLLQRSYAQIAEQFGCSAGQAKDAVVFLEQMGVVQREFRTLASNGMVYANVLYLALNVERLKELTFPCGDISPEGCPENSEGASTEISPTPVSEFRGGCAEISTDPYGKFPQTNTENTTKTTTEISSENSICLSDSPADGLTDAQQTAALVHELRSLGTIPKETALHLKKMRMLVQWLCDYEFFLSHDPKVTGLGDMEHQRALTLFVDCLCSMICTRTAHQYAGELVQPEDVLAALMQLAPELNCGDLNEFALLCVNAFCDAMDDSIIKNVKGYMKSVIWNCFAEYEINREHF